MLMLSQSIIEEDKSFTVHHYISNMKTTVQNTSPSTSPLNMSIDYQSSSLIITYPFLTVTETHS